MKKQANLKICVLGGRNFGKTSLLSSLILISGDKDSGITVSGGNEQKLSIYNEYKSNNGKLIATNWDDICKFRYNLTGNGNKKYKLTFIDYPGEFFQKFFSDKGAFSAKFLSMLGLQKKSSGTEDANRKFTKNEVKLAKQLVHELTSADAFIVLLPADIKKDQYKVNLQIFKTQLQVLLEKIHNINPYIPVCLAINKWDMFDKPDSELTDVLKDKPYQDFDNMLSLECNEHYFCQAISAFGKNRSAEAKTETEQEELKEEWDRKSEPVNVMQMLLKISEAAEKARYMYLREKYKNASVLSKVLHFPAVFASHYKKGANAEEDRDFCSKGFTRCISALAGTLVSITVLCFIIAGTLTTVGEFAYLKIQESSIAEIEKSFVASTTDNTSADKIKALKDNLSGHPLKLAFFSRSQIDNLRSRIEQIENQYNLRLWENAVAFCENARNKDEDPSKLKSEERKNRCETRIKHLEQEQVKLTDLPTRNSEKRTLKDCFKQRIEQEKRLLANIGKDGGLDDALYYALASKKPEEKCQYIEYLIDTYESTYSYRKTDFDNLKTLLKDLEQQYHRQLVEDLKKIKDIDSKNYARRIDLARQRISRIEREKQHLSTRSPWSKTNEELINAEKLNIEHWQHDSSFYTAFEAAMKTGDDQIQRLVKFLQDYDKKSYSRCVADWDKANEKKLELVAAVNSNLQRILTENSIEDRGISAIEKIKRLQSCINAYEEARRKNPTEDDKYREKIASLQRKLEIAKKDSLFEAEYDKIIVSADEGKLMRIHTFITGGEFKRDNFKHKVEEYKKLEQTQADLIKKWNKQQEEASKKYADDAKQNRANRLAQAKKLLAEYDRLLSEYLPNSSEYNNLTRLVSELKVLIAEHEKYNKLFNEFNKIKILSDSFYIVNEIAVFEDEYSASEYPAVDGIAIFTELQTFKKVHTESVVKEFQKAEGKFKKPSIDEFAKLAVYYQNLKQNADAFIQRLSKNVTFRKDLQKYKNQYDENIKKYQLFAKIAVELRPLIADDGQMSIKDAQNRLSAIKAFYANEHLNSILTSAPELGELLAKLKKVQGGVENFIGKDLSEKLEKISREISPGASPDAQITNWKKQLDLIDGYCAVMIQHNDNALYRNFSEKRQALQSRLGKAELKKRFDNDLATLEQKLETADLLEKITLLDTFINNYGTHRDFTTEIAAYKSQREIFSQKHKFDLFKQGCDTSINEKPSNVSAFNDLIAYRADILKKVDELKAMEKFSGIQRELEDLKNRLLGEINWVKKAIGDGSWNDIRQKEDAYKANPNESTYKSLEYAIETFDATEYSSYEDKVKEIKRNCQADWRKRKNIQETWDNLKNKPTISNWISFANSCVNSNFWGMGYNNQLVDKENTYSVATNLQVYKNYYNELARHRNINVEFISVSGLKNLGSVSGKLRIRYKLGDTMLFDMKFAKLDGEYSWESGQWRQMLKGAINFSAAMNIESRLNYRVYSIGNWSNENTYDNIYVDAVEILVPLVAGEESVRKWYSGYHGVTVGLKFTK